ncbi:polysaccharide deacetylase family protein [Sphingomonas sp.]|uniref:polysaccharide deacetylase family protein n=1 Tax=Sphingomonas sp. TaxID=28214 RepID=UPI002BDFBEAF|nr:polysaccharide deacetylase family protein [Sphingomonas sp.]HTG38634.1 polysaccharide deacetylase family protein [Sphingomonas sp.]
MRALLILIALLTAIPAQAQRLIALTFDDVPRSPGAWYSPDERTRRIVAALDEGGVRGAAFFVNPGSLARPEGAGGEARIAAYVRAGHVIANHGFSHLAASKTPAAAYIADIDRADAWLRGRPGFRPWYRFPYLDEGQGDKVKRDAIRAALAARRLANGYVTADGVDWHIEQRTIDAVTAGKVLDIEGLRALYVETQADAADVYDALAVRATGRSPVQVMLMHETDLAARFLPDLIAEMKRRGWRFVSADAAFADPIAAQAATVDVPSAQGTLVEAVAWARGLPAPRWYRGNDTALLDTWYDARVLKEGPVP